MQKRLMSRSLRRDNRAGLPAREPVERRVGGRQAGLELRERQPAHVDRDPAGAQRDAAVEHLAELLQIDGVDVEARVDGFRRSRHPWRMKSSAIASSPSRTKMPLSTNGTASRSVCAASAPNGATAASITVVYPRRAYCRVNAPVTARR